MSLLDKRLVYSPFEYEWAAEYWQAQQNVHWLHSEISFASDIADWNSSRLTESDKFVIGNILKSFTQTELFIEDYWATKVARWFKKPEIQMMAHAFASFESIHSRAYAALNESLGLADFSAFMQQPEAKAKIDRLINQKGKTREEIAVSLAVFSGFNEGVNLFSSFATLLNFSRRNLLKGVGKVIEWSVRDESLHSTAGCRLYQQFVHEYPEVLTDDLKSQLYEGAKETVKLEDDFIDSCYGQYHVEGLTAKELKAYIRQRANTKLGDLGLKSKWRPDSHLVSNVTSWFDVMTSGVAHQDFFAMRSSDYSKGHVDWGTMYG